MFLRGLNYDVGTSFRKGELSRPGFEEEEIKKEIGIIKHELHCDAIKITGHDVERLSKATEFALDEGLQVWLTPSYIDATQDEALQHLITCAIAAEKLRTKGDIIFVLGFEYSLFLKGFVKGDTIYKRLGNMFSPWGMVLNLLGLRRTMHNKLNSFLSDATGKIRKNFGGSLTYASGEWEKINWDLFDLVGVDHYRASYNKTVYVKQLQAYYQFNKPVAVLEFGCCAYKGADEKGAMGWAITEEVNGRRVIKGDPVRDESVQGNYITELLDILKQEKVYAAFVFTFINPVYKYSTDPKLDLDMASYGIVKPVDEPSYKGLPWIPKEAFYRLSNYYNRLNKDPANKKRL